MKVDRAPSGADGIYTTAPAPDLPTEEHTTDLEAWRARQEAKRRGPADAQARATRAKPPATTTPPQDVVLSDGAPATPIWMGPGVDSLQPDPLPARGPASEVYGFGLQRVLVTDVHPNPDNPRERLTEIDALAVSIRENGLVQPLIVRYVDDVLELVAGHRRLAAVKLLGWERVEAIVRQAMPDDDVLAQALVENGQRAGLDPIEEARGFARLKAMDGLSDKQVGAKVGRNQPYVSARIALLALPLDEQEEIRAGQMHLTEATYRARLTAGKVRPKGPRRHWHLGPEHDLATLAKARCQRLGHPRSGTVGGMACGACWESVIRADERQGMHDHAAKRGECPICGHTTTGSTS